MYRADAAPDRSILVSAFRSQVFGLDRQTGAIRWHYKMPSITPVELAVIDNIVVAVDGQALAFLDYATGQVHKVVQLAGQISNRPVMLIDGPHVYVTHNGEVSCYTSRGDLVWMQPFKGHGYGAVSLALPGVARQADSVGSK